MSLSPIRLSIITLTEGTRASIWELKKEVKRQIDNLADPSQVEHLIVEGDELYGLKMRKSLIESSGEYVCWVDDDDFISHNYVRNILERIQSPCQPEVITFGCNMVGYRKMWLRANREDGTTDTDGSLVWSANHYCAWKREIALSAPWLPRNYAAEKIWYETLSAAYPTLLESHIPEIQYFYFYNPNNTRCNNPSTIEASNQLGTHATVLRLKQNNSLAVRMGFGQINPGEKYQAYLPDGRIQQLETDEVIVLKHFWVP